MKIEMKGPSKRPELTEILDSINMEVGECRGHAISVRESLDRLGCESVVSSLPPVCDPSAPAEDFTARLNLLLRDMQELRESLRGSSVRLSGSI